ncbi:hydratase [Lacrimispora amygdalina]|uniref:Hydratase n=1 Tax=Lacrimispora amygdalina TaxID=253257 RepID=A0A3E2NHL9_9FIRM|nr:hydratase [Clostridium indicum]RFZ80512.1 hydratase [Clostridium indicum]
MVKLYDGGAYLVNGTQLIPEAEMAEGNARRSTPITKEEAKKGTIAYSILEKHNTSGNMDHLKLRFDSMASHDITFVGIIQTARASGLTEFPIPYVMTNCHNSLCAVGGTINEDDHVFGLSAAKKYGGIFVPPHIAVIHQYMREMMAGCGRMILGSDSHTRYGALGTMAIGEGGGELVKQLLRDTYDVAYPGVVAIYLTGAPAPFVGPHDVALAIIGAVFKNGYVKNKIMEFVGPGVSSMDTDYRNGVDVMTTETTCLSSVWRTDEDTREYLKLHGRESDYEELNPGETAYYDGVVYVDLSTIKPMIALPFHPSNTYEIDELNENLADILRTVEKEAAHILGTAKASLSLTDKITDGKLMVQQGVIAGCAGGNYSNVMMAAHMLSGKDCGNDIFNLSVYPSSQPVYMDLVKKGAISQLMAAGATVRTAFCGPCFGAGDTPSNNALSIRHTTRNFPNREGSKPGNGQISCVALMDARSIAATAANGGYLTSAQYFADDYTVPAYEFDSSSYDRRVYQGYKKAREDESLILGPNIKDWPSMSALTDNILLRVCSKIMDPVTTTDELIPSGETSSYRSNPLGLAEFTLSRRDPEYVGRSKEVNELEKVRKSGSCPLKADPELESAFHALKEYLKQPDLKAGETEIGSVIYAVKPGDGSAREQAASCQRVLGGLANIANEYATKRYRSNVMNWGMLPFLLDEDPSFEIGDFIYVPDIRTTLDGAMDHIPAYVVKNKAGNPIHEIRLHIADMTTEEREIVKAGCLINYNRNKSSQL